MTQTLESFTSCYGSTWRQGVALDHLAAAQAAGLVLRQAANGVAWLTGPDGGPAERVLCAELVQVWTEDGPITGRCGQVLVHWTCARHGSFGA